jgi:imidazolonepropionase-like amidohydrolase
MARPPQGTGTKERLGLGDSGSLRVGQRADIVLLRANPLENIDATQRISADAEWLP